MKRFCLSFLFLCSLAFPALGEEEAWEEKTVYATANGENTDICALYEIKVLMAPEKQTCIADINDAYTLQWKEGDMKVERERLLLPEAVKKIVASLEEKKDGKPVGVIQNTGYRLYKEKLLDYGFSISTFRRFVRFIFPEFGRIFIIPPIERPPSFFHVKHPYKELEITYCAMEARNGQIPVFFIGRNTEKNVSRSPKLGLVSLKTRDLREIGEWREDDGTIDGSLGWLDDDRLFFLHITRDSSFWGVFNIKTKKMVAQGESPLMLESPSTGKYINENNIEHYLIRGGKLYGLMSKDRLKLLYSGKKQAPHTYEEPGNTFR